MYIPRPKTFLQLILLGFSFVALPLLLALGFAAFYMDKMADQSQLAVYQAARATQNSRMLVEQVTALERAARQYQVLGDQALFEAYRETHEKFNQTINDFSKHDLHQAMREDLSSLSAIEQNVLNRLEVNPYTSAAAKNAVQEFERMAGMSRDILAGSHKVIDREVQVMYDIASNAQTLFFWLGLTLIPAMVLIVVGFTILIARPIRQVESGIRNLGEGIFDTPIHVAGPQDLESVGQQLDWLRRRLAEVEHEKVKFLRHVSHELKTPLTALREGTDLLADGLVGELKPDQREVVQILNNNTGQLQHLIEDLLNFSVAHLKQPTLEKVSVNLGKLMRRVILDQKLAIMSKQLQLKVRLDSVLVPGDQEKLRVVLDNLLSNAVKYSPKKGKLEIAIRRQAQNATVDISDNGPGIKPWEKKRIFEAFYQGENVAEGHIKGTGLGLSIARDYVKAHGGEISVGDASNRGAHFSVRLPVGVSREDFAQ